MKAKNSFKKRKEITNDELAEMVQRGFTQTATKDDLKNYVTKAELKLEIKNLKEDIETMLSRHLGTFRKDYDDLAARVKRLEHLVGVSK